MQKKLLITIPCYNEELVIKKTVQTIYAFAKEHFEMYDWSILVLDNASTDATWQLAHTLQDKYGEKILLKQEHAKGRGVALRNAWIATTEYDIYSYMDADLATDLIDFPLLIAAVDSGIDFATGSRYLPQSDIQRNIKREVLSRFYNMLIRFFLKAQFWDAQCGFKAMNRRVVDELITKTTDTGWFWDTELMILAGRAQFRVLEIPVTWREVRDELRVSKVSHWSEAVRQLKNIYTMRKKLKKIRI